MAALDDEMLSIIRALPQRDFAESPKCDTQALMYHWRKLPQVVFLSRQICTRVCRDKTRLLSRQNYAYCDKTFVATKLWLSRQNISRDKRQTICRDKHAVVATKDEFCRDQHVFAATKIIPVAAVANDTNVGLDTIVFRTK